MTVPSAPLVHIALPLLLLLATVPNLHAGGARNDDGEEDSRVAIENLQIKVMSGQQPVVGASIQLYEADLTSYTGASSPRLGRPVITGTKGTYRISRELLCHPHSLLYLVATGGDAGAGANASIALMTAVGSCHALHSSTVVINEVTTVASVYALAGFMSAPTSVSANATVGTNGGTRLALRGITNAFSVVHNLVDVHTGVALALTPAGNGTPPEAKIDSLANLLAACVESTGASSAPCTGLFTNAPSLTGVTPADTVQAILNIAHDPGANVAALSALLPATPYTPALTAAPNDLTLSVVYQGTGTGAYQAMAADGLGRIWVTASDTTNTGSVVEFGPLGVVRNTYTGGTTGISSPLSIAIDPQNTVWVENCKGGCVPPPYGSLPTMVDYSLIRIPSGGSPALIVPQGTAYYANLMNGLASDGFGDLYAYDPAYPGRGGIVKYAPDGSLVPGSFPLTFPSLVGGGNFSSVGPISLDGSGTIGVATSINLMHFFSPAGVLARTANLGASGLFTLNGSVFDHAGTFYASGTHSVFPRGSFNSVVTVPAGATQIFPPPDYSSTAGLESPESVVVDGAGVVWVSNAYVTDLSAFRGGLPFSPSGVPMPPFFYPPTAGGFQAGLASGALSVAIDTAGNVWIPDAAGTRVAEYVGAATPVTPLAVGVRDNTVGQRP